MLYHILNATKYSYNGLRRLLKEDAFRYEIFAAIISIFLFYILKVNSEDMATLLFLILLVLAFESLNTAIEEIVDFISPEYSETAKHAKDMGSFAVLCMLLASLFFVIKTLISIYQ